MHILDENVSKEKMIDFPPMIVLLFLAILFIMGSLLGAAAVMGYGLFKGMELSAIMGAFNENSHVEARNFIRTVNLISHTLTFTLPALVVMVFLYRKKWLQAFKLHRVPDLKLIWLATLFLLVAFPFIQVLYYVNQQIPLPDYLKTMEDTTTGMIGGLLTMESPVELAFNLLVIAVMPALGEELLFRGIVQPKFSEHFQNPTIGIWLTAFIFSAIHMQFEGFFPRMFLGAMIGYLFYWTNNLWVPIVAHLVNNGVQVLVSYFHKDLIVAATESGAEQEVSWLAGLVSLGLILGIGYLIYKISQHMQGEKILRQKL